MEATVFLFVNATKNISVQSKRFCKKYPLCLGNVSEDLSANNMKKTGLNRCIYNFFCWL